MYQTFDSPASTVCTHSGPPPSSTPVGTSVGSPVRADETIELAVTAPAGEFLFVGFATAPWAFYDPANFLGAFALGIPFTNVPVGLVGGSGTVALSIGAGFLGGADGLVLHVQPLFIDGALTATTGEPASIAIVAAGL